MRMSYLTSLNTQLFKNIAYVGSFEHFSVQLFFDMYFATRPRPALTAVIAGVLVDGTGGGINGKAIVFKGLARPEENQRGR